MAELNALLSDEGTVGAAAAVFSDDTEQPVTKRLEERESCVGDADSWVLVDEQPMSGR